MHAVCLCKILNHKLLSKPSIRVFARKHLSVGKKCLCIWGILFKVFLVEESAIEEPLTTYMCNVILTEHPNTHWPACFWINDDTHTYTSYINYNCTVTAFSIYKPCVCSSLSQYSVCSDMPSTHESFNTVSHIWSIMYVLSVFNTQRFYLHNLSIA